jgi:hypothetical protein
MTKQEMFNRAYIGVVQQGGRAVNESNDCVYYRESDGARCGWGHVLTKLQAKECPPGSLGFSDNVRDYCRGLSYTQDEMAFGSELQYAHDGAKTLDMFKERMAMLAQNFNLTIPEVTTEKKDD